MKKAEKSKQQTPINFNTIPSADIIKISPATPIVNNDIADKKATARNLRINLDIVFIFFSFNFRNHIFK